MLAVVVLFFVTVMGNGKLYHMFRIIGNAEGERGWKGEEREKEREREREKWEWESEHLRGVKKHRLGLGSLLGWGHREISLVCPLQFHDVCMDGFCSLLSHDSKSQVPSLKPWDNMVFQNMHLCKHGCIWKRGSVEVGYGLLCQKMYCASSLPFQVCVDVILTKLLDIVAHVDGRIIPIVTLRKKT